MPDETAGFVVNKGDEHGEAHEHHGVDGVVEIERKSGEENGDGEKEEALGEGLFDENEDENEEGSEEGEAEEELEADGSRITKYF